MGWEVALNKTHDGLFIRYVFFCNTADAPFGDVFFLSGCYDISNFYDAWGVVNRNIDPRTVDSKELWNCILRMKEYFGEDISEYKEEE